MLGGMAGALVATVVLLARPMAPGTADVALEVAAAALVSPGLCLAAGIGFIANQRMFDRAAIDGAATTPAIELAQRYLTNTVEQSVLAATAWFALAALWPERAAALLPSLAVTFLIARTLFALGYALVPWARAFGFALTFFPSIGVLLMAVSRLI